MTAHDSDARALLASRIRALLAAQSNVRERTIFGGVSFMVDERMAVAAGRDGDLLVRTNPDDYEAHVERGAVQAEMGNNRPMGRGWLKVPAAALASESELGFWLEIGLHSGSLRD